MISRFRRTSCSVALCFQQKHVRRFFLLTTRQQWNFQELYNGLIIQICPHQKQIGGELLFAMKCSSLSMRSSQLDSQSVSYWLTVRNMPQLGQEQLKLTTKSCLQSSPLRKQLRKRVTLSTLGISRKETRRKHSRIRTMFSLVLLEWAARNISTWRPTHVLQFPSLKMERWRSILVPKTPLRRKYSVGYYY